MDPRYNALNVPARQSTEDSHRRPGIPKQDGYTEGLSLDQANLGTADTAGDRRESLDALPTNDPNDPRNWSWTKKHLMLLALTASALLCDWGMTWGTTLFEAQAQTWHVSLPAVANSISGGIFMQGPGGVLAVPLAERYGRLPVLFWSQFLSCVVVIGASTAPTYAGFTACRTMQGLFNTAPQVIGLSIIQDMFYFRDRVRKINLWAFSFFCGPFLGPFFSALLVQKISWRAVYAILAGLHGLTTLLVAVFGEETLCKRSTTGEIGPFSGEVSESLTDKRENIKFLRLIGYKQFHKHQRPTIWTCLRKTLRVAVLPHLLLPTAVYICINFMWAIGIITTITQFIKPPPYLFSDKATALMYLAPFAGVLIGEVWGHFFNDLLQDSYVRRHSGVHKAENRLWATYPAVVLSIGGLVLYGQTLQHQLHWIGLAFGWGMVACAFMTATTAVSAYVLDSFPDDAAAASSWINFWRTTGGFCVSYFQLKWVHRDGAAVAFGCQAAIVGAAFAAIIATQIFGERWRK